MKIKIAFIVCALIHSTFYSQQVDFDTIINSDDSLLELSKIDTTSISLYDKATWLYYYADYYSNQDQHDIAFKNIIKAKNYFLKLNKEEDVVDCNILLLEILNHQNNLNFDKNDIINELEQKAVWLTKEKAASIYTQIALKYFDLNDAENTVKYLKKSINLLLTKQDSSVIGKMYINIAVVQSELLRNHDSALYYLKKSAPILRQYKDFQNLSANYNNQGKNYQRVKQYDKAIEYFKKSEAIPLSKNVLKTKLIYYKNISKVYELNKDYKNATHYLNKYTVLKDSINDIQQNIAISDIKEKYDNEKLRVKNLKIEAEKNRNRNLLIISLLLSFFGIITSLLIYKNIKRKQAVIKAEKRVEQQKVENLLKKHELIAIDAMIEGQEKERQLIASDLHDDLGALMATLQFNFENLYKYRNSENYEDLFAQTKVLIKEAYQKIRSIANVKNSGVIAKQGLLKAVINNAEKIAKLNNLKIEVKSHGLINRLENQLELVIFRIIQELLTNIVKHAEATEVVIHLTNHDDLLNIMVEDNGKGFDIKTVSKSDGMGIQSIEKRVEFIDGKVIIESILDRGTAIIIDIPL